MKRFWITTCCLVAATSAGLSQAGRNTFPSAKTKDAAKTVEETAKVLKQAKASGQSDITRNDGQKPDIKKVGQLVNKVRSEGVPQQSFSEQKKSEESEEQLRNALSRVSPEGKALLAQNSGSPTTHLPTGAPGTASPKAVPVPSGSGPQPQPLRPVSIEDPTKAPPQTIINAGTSFFDSKAGFGVFVDNVTVDHPEFDLVCDELQVFMEKEAVDAAAKPEAGAAPAPPPAPAGPTAGELAASGAADQPASGGTSPSAEGGGDSSLKRAIAKGRKVVITKMGAKGQLQTGIGREADYDGKTGDVILRGWPQVQEGMNLTVAIEPTTYFIIKQNGQFQAMGGRAQTRIIQKDDKKGQNPGAAPAAGPPVPGAPPAPVLNTRTPGAP